MSSPWDDLVRDLPHTAVQAAMVHLVEVRRDAGELLVEAGSDTTELYCLLEGRVDIVRDGIRVDASGPGEIVGEMAMFRTRRRVASVRAALPTRALRLSREGYRELQIAENPVVFALDRQILAQMMARLRRLDLLAGRMARGEPNPWPAQADSLLTRLRALLRPARAQPSPRPLDASRTLEDSYLFRGAPLMALAALGARFQHRTFPPGDALCRQGTPGDTIFVIAQGTADVFASVGPSAADAVHKLGSVGPGAAVGMTSLVEGRTRMASVIAVDQVDALALDAAALREILADEGPATCALRTALIRALAEQIDEAAASVVQAATARAHPAEVYTDALSLSDQISVDTLVWTGMLDAAEIVAAVLRATDSPIDEAALREQVQRAVCAKQAEERSWPERTDCDRLDAALARLAEHGIVALHGVGANRSELREAGMAITSARQREGLRGWCGYDARAPERALKIGCLSLHAGALQGGYAQSQAIVDLAASVLREHDLDATAEYLLIEVWMQWQRRSAVVA